MDFSPQSLLQPQVVLVDQVVSLTLQGCLWLGTFSCGLFISFIHILQNLILLIQHIIIVYCPHHFGSYHSCKGGLGYLHNILRTNNVSCDTKTTDKDYLDLEPKLARPISLPVHVSCGGMKFKFINGINNTISVI